MYYVANINIYIPTEYKYKILYASRQNFIKHDDDDDNNSIYYVVRYI